MPTTAVPPVLRDSVERSFLTFAKSIGTLVDDGGHGIPSVYPVLQQIDVDSDGRVWVRRHTDSMPSDIDVFDDEGKHIASVRVPRALGTQLFIARQHLYDIELDADDVPVVVRYRIHSAQTR